MIPRKVTPTAWADVKKRIAAAAKKAAAEGKTLKIIVSEGEEK